MLEPLVKRILSIGLAMSVSLSTQAIAAGFGTPEPEVVIRDPSFNWNRVYLGAFGGAWLDFPDYSIDSFRAGGVVGRNVTIGERFMIGGELSAGYYAGADYPEPVPEVYGTFRAGLRFDKAFIYGSAGLGWDVEFGTSQTLGGGGEFAINSVMSLRADARLWRGTGEPFEYLSVTGGLSWYLR